MNKLGYILNHFSKISLGKLEINSTSKHCPIKVQITQTNNDRAVNFKCVQQKARLTERAAIPVYCVCFFLEGAQHDYRFETLKIIASKSKQSHLLLSVFLETYAETLCYYQTAIMVL